ncbi:MAG: hypothetical protein IKF68_02085, partial [Erysipelotrichaceae bacterium]|nr:hypothetical protein [Erysipelotrichaceae bacterium]
MNDPNRNRNRRPGASYLIPYLLVAVFLGLMLFSNPNRQTVSTNVDYIQLNSILDSGTRIKDARI